MVVYTFAERCEQHVLGDQKLVQVALILEEKKPTRGDNKKPSKIYHKSSPLLAKGGCSKKKITFAVSKVLKNLVPLFFMTPFAENSPSLGWGNLIKNWIPMCLRSQEGTKVGEAYQSRPRFLIFSGGIMFPNMF